MLQVTGLAKRYGDVVALDGCSFEVRDGRITGFLGPNGAGKTTTMRAIFGLVQPDAGELLWAGSTVDLSARRAFGYMPEERGVYPKMRVGDQLVFFAELAGLTPQAAREAAQRWLRLLGLEGRGRDRVEALSHGNQQRVQLAVALAHQPQLLVLDEPFSGLDVLAVDGMMGLLRAEAARGAAVLFSSHQLDLVEDLCDDVVIIDHGRVVLSGTVEDLRSRSPRRQLELVVDGDSSWLEGVPGAEVIQARDRHVQVTLSDDVDLVALLDRAPAGGSVRRLSYGPPSLSDLFREAVSA